MTLTTPAVKAAAGDPRRVLDFCDTPLKRLVLPFIHEFWLRPEQVIPPEGWLWYMLVGGRGWGKSRAFGCYVNREVERGSAPHVALMSTNADRVEETQIRFLIETAPPWFRPWRERGGLTWPNGVRAEAFTPEAPDAVRSENISLSWVSEIVAWPAATRMTAFRNITTATRKGKSQVLIDTTAAGRNDVRRLMNDMHAQDPRAYRMVHGSMTDNPLFSREYLRSQFLQYVEGSRRFAEEVMGESFEDAAGALWTTKLLDETRRLVAPTPFDTTLIGLDPAYSDRSDADETGLVVVGRKGRETFLTKDLSGILDPVRWADMVCQTAIAERATGVVIEANSSARLLPAVLGSACRSHALAMVEIPRDAPWPPWRAGVLHVKLVVSRSDKYSRAVGPAGETVANRFHLVGEHPQLEHEMTTHEPESKDKSPGRLDAMVHAVNELAGLTTDTAADNAPGVLAAAQATATLNQMLAMGPPRRVGL